MKILENLILFIKNIFFKQDEVKQLPEPKISPKISMEQNKKKNFVESLKITPTKIRTHKNIEILTCNGDGLGIQKEISC